jgi:hypothetical protein
MKYAVEMGSRVQTKFHKDWFRHSIVNRGDSYIQRARRSHKPLFRKVTSETLDSNRTLLLPSVQGNQQVRKCMHSVATLACSLPCVEVTAKICTGQKKCVSLFPAVRSSLRCTPTRTGPGPRSAYNLDCSFLRYDTV